MVECIHITVWLELNPLHFGDNAKNAEMIKWQNKNVILLIAYICANTKTTYSNLTLVEFSHSTGSYHTLFLIIFPPREMSPNVVMMISTLSLTLTELNRLRFAALLSSLQCNVFVTHEMTRKACCTFTHELAPYLSKAVLLQSLGYIVTGSHENVGLNNPKLLTNLYVNQLCTCFGTRSISSFHAVGGNVCCEHHIDIVCE